MNSLLRWRTLREVACPYQATRTEELRLVAACHTIRWVGLYNSICPKECEEKHSHTAAHRPVVKPPAVISTAVPHTPTQQQGWETTGKYSGVYRHRNGHGLFRLVVSLRCRHCRHCEKLHARTKRCAQKNSVWWRPVTRYDGWDYTIRYAPKDVKECTPT